MEKTPRSAAKGGSDPVPGVRHNRRTRARLLENFAETGRIDLACSAVGVSRDTHYEWLKKDPEYSAAFELARDRAVDALESEAWRRGREGVEKPIVHAGRRVVEVVEVDGEKVERPLVVREYSDQLVMFLLKGRRREVYGDKLEATGKDGSPLFPVDAVRSYMQSVPDDAE